MFHGIPHASKRQLLQMAGSVFMRGVTWPFRQVSEALTVAKDRPYWRFCQKCHVLFYTDAKANSCAAGGSHAMQGYQFRLPFDGPETPKAQRHWRCCNQCQAMFYDGYQAKGRCAAGGGHVAQGYNFVLPHPRS